MTAENNHLRFQLHNLYPKEESSPPTATTVQKYLEDVRATAKVSDKAELATGSELPEQVIPYIIPERGDVRVRKLKRFSNSVKRIIREYGVEALDHLDKKCVKKNGNINQRIFREKLQKSWSRSRR